MSPLRIPIAVHRFVVRTLRSNLPVSIALGGLVAGFVGGVVLWLGVLHHRFLPKNFGVVEAGLIFRSGQVHGAILEDVVRGHRVLQVIDVAGSTDQPDEAEEQAILERLGVPKFTVEGLSGDGVGPIDTYVRAYSKLVEARRAGRPVLVHCRAGSERTGALVSLYRVFAQHWTPAEAYREYLRYRHRPPRTHVLWTWLNQQLPTFVEGVVASGALTDVPAPLPRFGPPEVAGGS